MEALARVEHSPWEHQFLKWFAQTGLPLEEQRLALGGLSYFHFSTGFRGPSGRLYSAHGCSPNRTLAAVKCAAEYVERDYMLKFFKSQSSCVPAARTSFMLGHLKSGKMESLALPPYNLRTSNGWAVHSDRALARQNAYLEALERHLLLKSYFKLGWSGFRQVHCTEGSDLSLYFLLSRYVSKGYAGGLVVAKSALYPGISVGHTIGEINSAEGAEFWESALYEAVTKILVLQGQPFPTDVDSSWLEAETKSLLDTPWSKPDFSEASDFIEDRPSFCNLMMVDLDRELKLGFPLYAAFAWGGTMIPLIHRSVVALSTIEYLAPIFDLNGMALEIPERHPVL